MALHPVHPVRVSRWDLRALILFSNQKNKALQADALFHDVVCRVIWLKSSLAVVAVG